MSERDDRDRRHDRHGGAGAGARPAAAGRTTSTARMPPSARTIAKLLAAELRTEQPRGGVDLPGGGRAGAVVQRETRAEHRQARSAARGDVTDEREVTVRVAFAVDYAAFRARAAQALDQRLAMGDVALAGEFL